MSACEYCGGSHSVTALCASRRRLSRRAFLFLGASAVVGAAVASTVPSWALPSLAEVGSPLTFKGVPLIFDSYVPPTSYWVTNKSVFMAYQSLMEGSPRYTAPERVDQTAGGTWADLTRSTNTFWRARL